MKKSRRKTHLSLESLEDRRVPATWGMAWPDAQNLSLSFVPDGTQVEGQSSQLFQKLDSELGVGKWETPLLKAFQTWAMDSNINIGVVGDGGQTLGTAGPAQGDPRFGDIRISAEPLPAGVLAITAPYDPSTGTFSGDMILNSSVNYNDKSGGYDLFTVSLHEAGHVFGFADSADPSSFMYDVYTGPTTGLRPGAVPALQSLYGGARNINSLNGSAISDDPSHPATIQLPWTNTSATPVTTSGDIDLIQDVDSDQFKAPSLLTAPAGIDIQVQTSGVSLLTPVVQVFDAANHLVASASASGPLDGGTSLHLAGLIPGLTYSVRISGATGDAFSVGSYQMTFSVTNLSLLLPGGKLAHAAPLQQTGGSFASPILTGVDTINQHSQSDLYAFRSPLVNLSGLTAELQDVGIGLLPAQLKILDAAGNLVASSTSTVGTSTTTSIHLPVLLLNSTYYVQVINGTLNSHDVGAYRLTVALNSSAVPTTAPTLPTSWLGTSWSDNPNTTAATAASLQTPSGYTSKSFYEALGAIGAATSHEYYSLQTPKVAKGQAGFMTVTVESLQVGGLLPWVQVFDQKGNGVAAQVLASEGGVSVVQIPIASGGGQYVLEVSASDAGGGGSSGSYYLGTTFGTIASSFRSLASGTLPAVAAGVGAGVSQATPLHVDQSAVYQFVLAGSPTNAPSDVTLKATIIDARGDVVASFSSSADQAASTSVFLGAGDYTILIGEVSASGTALTPTVYTFFGDSLTDPIKPYVHAGGAGGVNPNS